MHFIPCMHHVKFNIFHHAQLSVHSTEYTVAKQLILILMCIPTKLLYVKQYLHTPCAHYYVCAHCARLNSARASTHNNIPCGTTIYRAYWHANVFPCGDKIYRASAHQPFPWILRDSNSSHFEVTLLWIFASTEPLWPIQAQCWTKALIPFCNIPPSNLRSGYATPEKPLMLWHQPVTFPAFRPGHATLGNAFVPILQNI